MTNRQLLELVPIRKGGTTSSMSRRKGRQKRVLERGSPPCEHPREQEGDETEATSSAQTIAGAADAGSEVGLPFLFFRPSRFSRRPCSRRPLRPACFLRGPLDSRSRLSPVFLPARCSPKRLRIARAASPNIGGRLRIAADAAAEFNRFAQDAAVEWSGLSQTDRFFAFSKNVINFPSNR